MSRWRMLNLRFIIKEEYREFFCSVILNNQLTHNSDEVLNKFILLLEDYSKKFEGKFSDRFYQFYDDKKELLSIFNEANGECNISIEYNMHNNFVSGIVKEFIDDLLPYIIEDNIEYVDDWIED